jgi:zinc transport system ATP-binding protein
MQDLKMGYVPQKLTIKRNIPLTVLEFIYTGFTKQSLIISKTDKALILDWLIKMKLDKSLLNEKVSHLSGGQLQRIYLIRSLISNPEVLILDEPASALDPNFREYFYELIKDIRRNNNLTIIHITHDLTDVILENSLVMYVDQEIKFFGTYIDYNKFEHEGHHHD